MSVTKFDQQYSSSSVRRSSLLVNLSTTKKRSSVTTFLASSCSTLGSSRKRTVDSCSRPTSTPITSRRSSDEIGNEQLMVDRGNRFNRFNNNDGDHHETIERSNKMVYGSSKDNSSVLHTVLVYPQSAPPTLNEPSYCIATNDNSLEKQRNLLDAKLKEPSRDLTQTESINDKASNQTTNPQQQSIFQVVEVAPGDTEAALPEREVKHIRQSGGKNSRENSPEPIIEVKNTSSSSSASTSSDNSAHSSDNNEDSRKLVRRRTVRRYHRSTVDDPNDLETHKNSPSSTVELTISINKSTTGDHQKQQQLSEQKQEKACEFGRSQFRTRQIGGYQNHQIKQQKHHKQQQEQTKTSSSSSSSSSLTSSTSTSKIAKCSITTNRKSTTSHRELFSESSLSSKATTLDSKKTSGPILTTTTTTATMLRDNNPHLLANGKVSPEPGPQTSDMKTGQRLLELRLNNQHLFDKTNNSLLDSNGRSSIEVKQQEESSVHHSRQSFSSSSSTSTSMRAGSLRKAAISSSLASEAAVVSRHSNTGPISTDLSALSSSRHYKSSSASLMVSGNSNDPQGGSNSSTPTFLNSESLFSSPDVRSLVKEIGTDFAELENALISTASGFGNRSSLSSRLFGANRRPLSPLGSTSQYPAITAPNECLVTSSTTALASNSKIHPVKRDQSHSEQKLSTTDLPGVESGFPYKRSHYKSNLSSASESSAKSSGEKIKELMCQAQSHVDRYGVATGNPDSAKASTFTQNYGPAKSSLPENQDQRRQAKEKAVKDEGVELHQNHCKAVMTESIERIDQRMSDLCKKFSESRDTKEAIDLLKLMIQMIEKAWSVPVCGDDLGFKLCNSLREAGGLDIILGFIQESDISRDTLSNHQKESPYLLFNNAPPLDEKSMTLMDNLETGNKQESNHQQAKNKSSTNKLRLNLSKLNQSSESAQSLDLPALSPPVEGSQASVTCGESNNTGKRAKDSDSEIFTSDLGLDSTSVDSLCYVTPPSVDHKLECNTSLGQNGDFSNPTEDQSKNPDRNHQSYVLGPQETTTGVAARKNKSGHRSDTDAEAEKESDPIIDPIEVPFLNREEVEEEETNLIKDELVFLSARLLSQCLTSENRNYIVENGLDQVIRLACNLTTMKSTQSKRLLSHSSMGVARETSTLTSSINSIAQQNSQPLVDGQRTISNEQTNSNAKQQDTQTKSQKKQQQPTTEQSEQHAVIGTEILQHLFKHSEDTCSRMISLGGLEAILYGCRSSNIETLRHCASALANLALYGGPEGQQMMIEQKAHVWLFPLAFNEDDNIQYYACLAIVVLVANQEIEADVLKSSTLDLVEPFVTSHEPQKFAESTTSHVHGQSDNWLRKLIPLLESKREEARNLACFHFAMEAYIKKEQGQSQVFKEIGAVEPLKKVGSSPIAIASKFACQALRLIGEKEPHKLSQQVPLWTSEDVSEWVSQIGFERFKSAFVDSRVDGDLLLQLDEEMLKTDIGIDNGIIRRRFLRELSYLKRIADYSSVDKSGLSSLLGSTSHDFVQYIYPMIQLGVTRDNIHMLDSEQLLRECRVSNTIHRMKLTQAIKELQEKIAVAAASNEYCSTDGGEQKTLDVFMSYRRSTGSQLASLLKVFLELRNFSVFIDVERLEAGKFDNNLLDSIKAAKNFILILSPNALDRCIGDHECKDWIHKEIVAALGSNCNIIPIIDNFHWPDAEQLPEDMRSITYFNGVRWIHDYQDACVDKVERFIRGEINNGTSIGGPQSVLSAQSSLQRLACGSNYSSTPSMVATPSILASGFPSGSVSAYASRVPFDTDYHPLSLANHQYLQQHSQTSASGVRRQP